jgi:hypothetical protein
MWGSAGRFCNIRFDEPGETKVSDFDVEMFVEKNIFGFQVAMTDSKGMKVFKSINNLSEESHGL